VEPRPPLVELGDIRGDLHCHTTWSDGRASVLEMAEAARALGYEYLAICDHTTNVRVVPGLEADDVRRQGEEIAAANEVVAPFRILRGIECDILPDGTLDLPDDVCSTDAHSVRGLANMQNCIATARRAGATARDIVNARPLEEVLRR